MTYIEYLRKLEGKPNDTVCETREAGSGIDQRDDEAPSDQRHHGEDLALGQAIDQLNAYFAGDTVGSNRYYAPPYARMSGAQLSGRYSQSEQQEAVSPATPDDQPTTSAEEYIRSRNHYGQPQWMYLNGRPTISVDIETEEPRSGAESTPRRGPYGTWRYFE
jgi:hypothetical protein